VATLYIIEDRGTFDPFRNKPCRIETEVNDLDALAMAIGDDIGRSDADVICVVFPPELREAQKTAVYIRSRLVTEFVDVDLEEMPELLTEPSRAMTFLRAQGITDETHTTVAVITPLIAERLRDAGFNIPIFKSPPQYGVGIINGEGILGPIHVRTAELPLVHLRER
jgi:hypothetical protein